MGEGWKNELSDSQSQMALTSRGVKGFLVFFAGGRMSDSGAWL